LGSRLGLVIGHPNQDLGVGSAADPTHSSPPPPPPHLFGVAQAVGHRDAQRDPLPRRLLQGLEPRRLRHGDGEGGLLDAVEAARLLKHDAALGVGGGVGGGVCERRVGGWAWVLVLVLIDRVCWHTVIRVLQISRGGRWWSPLVSTRSSTNASPRLSPARSSPVPPHPHPNTPNTPPPPSPWAAPTPARTPSAAPPP
jgi:hypothetical protein